jgi:hypothetical protein
VVVKLHLINIGQDIEQTTKFEAFTAVRLHLQGEVVWYTLKIDKAW